MDIRPGHTADGLNSAPLGAFRISAKIFKLRIIKAEASEIPWRDLHGFRLSEAASEPVLLEYRFPKLELSGLVLFAPVGHAILTPEFAKIDRTWARSYINNRNFFRKFNEFLVSLGFPQGWTIHSLFGPYANFGSYLNGKKKAFDVLECPLAANYRLAGALVPSLTIAGVQQAIIDSVEGRPNAFLVADEGQEDIPTAPGCFHGLGRLIGMPAIHLRGFAKKEKDEFLAELIKFEAWTRDNTLPGSYIDFVRGVFGSSFAGPLQPSDAFEYELALTRLRCVRIFCCETYKLSLNLLLGRRDEINLTDTQSIALLQEFERTVEQLNVVFPS